QAEDGIRDRNVTGVQTCALPILAPHKSFIQVHPNLWITLWINLGILGDKITNKTANRIEMLRYQQIIVKKNLLKAQMFQLKMWRSEERRVGKEGKERERGVTREE